MSPDPRLMMSDQANEIPIEAWNTILFEKFVRFRHIAFF
jgi:hypothetical protein